MAGIPDEHLNFFKGKEIRGTRLKRSVFHNLYRKPQVRGHIEVFVTLCNQQTLPSPDYT